MTKQKIVCRKKVKLSKNHKRLLDRYFNKKQIKYRNYQAYNTKGGFDLATINTVMETIKALTPSKRTIATFLGAAAATDAGSDAILKGGILAENGIINILKTGAKLIIQCPLATLIGFAVLDPALAAVVYGKFVFQGIPWLTRMVYKVYQYFSPSERKRRLMESAVTSLDQTTSHKYILQTTKLISKLVVKQSPRLKIINELIKNLIQNIDQWENSIEKIEFIDEFKNNLLLNNKSGENCRIALMQVTTISSEKDGKVYIKDFDFNKFQKILPLLMGLVKITIQELNEKAKFGRMNYENTQTLEEIRNLLTLLLNNSNNKTSNKTYEKNVGKMVNDALFGERE